MILTNKYNLSSNNMRLILTISIKANVRASISNKEIAEKETINQGVIRFGLLYISTWSDFYFYCIWPLHFPFLTILVIAPGRQILIRGPRVGSNVTSMDLRASEHSSSIVLGQLQPNDWFIIKQKEKKIIYKDS